MIEFFHKKLLDLHPDLKGFAVSSVTEEVVVITESGEEMVELEFKSGTPTRAWFAEVYSHYFPANDEPFCEDSSKEECVFCGEILLEEETSSKQCSPCR